MRMTLLALVPAALLVAASGAAAQDIPERDVQRSEPIQLTAAQMDQITAGSLLLPNGDIQQNLFDNPAPNVNGYFGFCDADTGMFCHPALTRRSDQVFEAAAGHEPSVTGFPDGPWTATAASPVIACVGFYIPAGTGPGGTGSGCSP
jgi:hypothetical protein